MCAEPQRVLSFLDRIYKIDRIGEWRDPTNPDNPVSFVKKRPPQASAPSAALREETAAPSTLCLRVSVPLC